MNDPLSTHAAFSPLDEEELVAYLDGELDAEACQRVEQRLADDPQSRLELQRLQRTWDYLDRLPETSVDENFTRSTIEMVTVAASQEVAAAERALPVERRMRRLVLTALLLVAGLLGFAATAALWPDPNRQLIAELPLLENLELYVGVEDVQFVRDLAASKVLVGPEFEDEPPARFPPREDDSPAGRQRWIRALPAEDQAVLEASYQRYADLPEREQKRLARLADQVARASDAETLHATLARYQRWLTELSPGQRAELLAAEGAERLKLVRQFRNRQLAERSRRLSPADMQALVAWLGERAWAHREEILRGVPQRGRQLWQRQPRAVQQRWLIEVAWRKARFSGRSAIAPLEPHEFEQLRERLSPESQARLDQADTPEKQQELIAGWLQYTVARSLASRGLGEHGMSVSQEELAKFFDEGLTNDQRARLLSLPSDEMQRELRRLYFDDIRVLPRHQGRERPPRRPFRPPPEPHRGRPRT